MTIPHLPRVRIALWEELEQSSGISESRDIIERLAERFGITTYEREIRDPSGQRTFDHRVHSAVAQSRIVGWLEQVEEGGRGMWKLTSDSYNDNPSVSD